MRDIGTADLLFRCSVFCTDLPPVTFYVSGAGGNAAAGPVPFRANMVLCSLPNCTVADDNHYPFTLKYKRLPYVSVCRQLPFGRNAKQGMLDGCGYADLAAKCMGARGGHQLISGWCVKG